MLYEYILTAFKVLIGLLNNKRIIYIAIVALAILLLWELFSLLFSYQIRFAKGVRNINEYISRNGISGINKDGLDELISKMPTEFVRGYSAYERDVHTLPSQHIKREIVLDLELQGGVFKQRALVNVYVNLVFIMLSLFCVALISNESPLTGYSLAEAFVVPLFFLLISKIIYNIYSAIRQNQYKIAIYEFNEMINNFDRAAISEYGYYGDQEDGKPKVVQTVQAAPVDNKTNEELQNIQNQLAENKTKIDEFNQSIVDFKLQLEEFLKEKPSTEVSNATSDGLSEDSLKEIQNIILTKIEEINNSNKNSFTAIEKSVDEKMDELGEKIKNIQVVSVDALSDIASRIERKNEQANVVEEKSTKQQKIATLDFIFINECVAILQLTQLNM